MRPSTAYSAVKLRNIHALSSGCPRSTSEAVLQEVSYADRGCGDVRRYGRAVLIGSPRDEHGTARNEPATFDADSIV